jgi:hypothetical protein
MASRNDGVRSERRIDNNLGDIIDHRRPQLTNPLPKRRKVAFYRTISWSRA